MARRSPAPESPAGRFDWVGLLLGSMLLAVAAASCFGFGRSDLEPDPVELGP